MCLSAKLLIKYDLRRILGNTGEMNNICNINVVE